MYFDQEESSKTFSAVARLLRHSKSRLWFDFVSKDVVDNTTGKLEMESFIRGIRRMGEPFINGYSNVKRFLRSIVYALYEAIANAFKHSS